jgi:hypothetical protein
MKENVGTADRQRGVGRRQPYLARLALLFAGTLVLAGCPGERGAGEAIPRDTLPAPPPVADPQPGVPAEEQVHLDPRTGSTVAGTAMITPREAETVVVVSIQAAPPNATLPVRLHTGQCEDEGAERAALDPVRTDAAGTGRTEFTVPLPAHEILTGQHYIQVYEARGELHRGLSCGNIPARPDLHPGIAPP